MATFDRFDICEAYACLENDWNVGGVLHERRRSYSVGVQLHRMRFEGRPSLATSNLSDNAREIYAEACQRLNLGHGGYHDCAVPECFEIAIGWGAPVCNDCDANGCGEAGECQCPHDDGETCPSCGDAYTEEAISGGRCACGSVIT